jgi:hypothetical protein
MSQRSRKRRQCPACGTTPKNMGLHLQHSVADKRRKTKRGHGPKEISTPMGGQPGWRRA